MRVVWQVWVAACVFAAAILPPTANAQSTGTLKQFGRVAYGLLPEHVAVVVNEADARSVEAGEYYRERRGVPPANVLRVRIPDAPRKLTVAEFERLRFALAAQMPAGAQAIVLMWTAPYAVECNAITAALTFGLDAELCAKTCGPGRRNPYFDSASVRPYDDFGLRLAMLLPVESVEAAKATIDRGIASDGARTMGTAYLVTTSDPHRNVRAALFPRAGRIAAPPLNVVRLRTDAIRDRADIMFYLTGAVSVPYLDTLAFLPGALADHLTSLGGDLLGGHQMSSLRWLEAGATASYGTVSEPCNHWQKFPHPAVLMKHYLAGASAVEAYWKSVAWPAQGLVIGEPLASPYRR